MVWYEFNARSTSGHFDRAEYYDEWITLDYYEIQTVSSSGVDLIGFAEDEEDNGSFEEFMLSSPLILAEFPLVAGNSWSSDASVTLPEGTLSATMAGEVVGQVDLVYEYDGFEVVWTDVWRMEREVEVRIGGSTISNEESTFWVAPGIGIIREIYQEEDLEEDEWFEYDRWLFLDLD